MKPSFPYSPRHSGKNCLPQEKDIKEVKLERSEENVNENELIFLITIKQRECGGGEVELLQL